MQTPLYTRLVSCTHAFWSEGHSCITKCTKQSDLHHSVSPVWLILLYNYAIWTQKRKATYQRGIKLCLHSHLWCNAEAYVGDVVVRTQEDEGLISDLAETFDNLRKFKMKLNPEKCTFGVPIGKLLGYMVSRHRINPNPEKVSAITKMKPPENLHDV
jgi:hypothetical protein